MLAGIIKEENNDYYIHINKENNQNILDIIRVDNNSISHLNKNEIIKLVCELLISKLTFKEKSNGYDIYLDEANNKRYFKNGKEDYQMFLLNNGVNALLFDENEDEDENEDDDEIDIEKEFANSPINLFIMKHYNKIIKVFLPICILTVLAEGIVIHNMDKKPDIALFAKNEGVITTEKVEELIGETKLSEQDKQFICNKDLLDDIITCSISEVNSSQNDLQRNYDLYQKLSDINIKTFANGSYSAAGYYNQLEPNCIYVTDKIEKGSIQYYDVISHEYIHLLQVAGILPYISEASAELISSEYYNQEANGYSEEVKRLKVLMEIIGSDAIFKYNFKNNDTSFYTEVKKYLSEEDYNALIELFNTHAEDWAIIDGYNKEKEINDKIDVLLAKMYYNKTGENIKDNELINSIYTGEYVEKSSERIYFNKHNPDYAKDIHITHPRVNLDLIDFSQINTEYNASIFKYYTHLKFDKNETKNLEGYNIVREYVAYDLTDGVKIVETEEDHGFVYEKDGITCNPKEALEKGWIIEKDVVCVLDELDYLDREKASNADHIEIVLEDGSIASYKYDAQKKQFEALEHYKSTEAVYPSMEKFYTLTDDTSSKYGYDAMYEEYLAMQNETTQKHI